MNLWRENPLLIRIPSPADLPVCKLRLSWVQAGTSSGVRPRSPHDDAALMPPFIVKTWHQRGITVASLWLHTQAGRHLVTSKSQADQSRSWHTFDQNTNRSLPKIKYKGIKKRLSESDSRSCLKQNILINRCYADHIGFTLLLNRHCCSIDDHITWHNHLLFFQNTIYIADRLIS